jgi:homocysteine S-methyltransferase
MHAAADPVAAGVANAKEVLDLARGRFDGACIIPPFDHYEIMPHLLESMDTVFLSPPSRKK